MKIMIIGGSSFIGSYFVKSFSKNNDVKYSFLKNQPPYSNGLKLDITNRESVKAFFQKNESDLIIFSSALTNVDLCETDPNLAQTTNVQGTQNIVDFCKLFKTKIIYISTSAVFDGNKSIYCETDKPNPTSVYGTTKLKGEEIIMESEIPFLILRTDQPYGWKEKWQHANSVTRVIDSLKRNESFNEISDWFNTPTYVPDFVDATNILIDKKMEGIFHLVGSDYINRYEWAHKVAKIFNLNDKLIQKINSSELKLPVKRNNIHLSNKKLKEKIGYNMLGVEKGLEGMLEEQINF